MVLQEALCDTPLGLYRIVCTETALYAIERAKGAQAQWEPGPLANRLKGEMRSNMSFLSAMVYLFLLLYIR